MKLTVQQLQTEEYRLKAALDMGLVDQLQALVEYYRVRDDHEMVRELEAILGVLAAGKADLAGSMWKGLVNRAYITRPYPALASDIDNIIWNLGDEP